MPTPRLSIRKGDITAIKLKDVDGNDLRVGDFVARGRDGLVYRARFDADGEYTLAVKFFVPLAMPQMIPPESAVAGVPEALAEDRQRTELKRLKELHHPHIQRYVTAGTLRYDKEYFVGHSIMLNATAVPPTPVPFVISRFIAGDPFSSVLQNRKTSRADIARVLLHAALGCEYLHAHDVFHGDLRAENIMVEAAAPHNTVLIDFGLSKHLVLSDDSKTQVPHAFNTVPEEISALLHAHLDEQRMGKRNTLRRILFPCLDLFDFGRLIDRLLNSPAGLLLTSFDRGYLTLLRDELRRWNVVRHPKEEGPLTEMTGAIRSAADLRLAAEKLAGGPDYFRRALHAREAAPPRIIQRHNGLVEVRNEVAPFLTHPALRRLHNLNQLSLLHYVYPSAGQSRFDHVVGTLGCAQDFWRALSHSAPFLFHMNVDDIRRLELVALHHDVEHFPFLHYFEEAGIPHLSRKTFLPIVMATERPTNSADPDEPRPTLKSELAEFGITPEYLLANLDDTGDLGGTPANQIIRSIVNSGVDVDKCSYLRDDARFSGVPFGSGVDYEGLLAGLSVDKVTTKTGTTIWHAVFDHDALPAVESLCFARYWNFARIYWHHTNRALEAMIIHTIRAVHKEEPIGARFLRETQDKSEAEALVALAELYRIVRKHDAPIEGLWSNRDVIFKRVWELSLVDHKPLLHSLQGEGGWLFRERLEARVDAAIRGFAAEHGYAARDRRVEVIVDFPMRPMHLGGAIYVRPHSGLPKPIEEVSPVIRELKNNFDQLSKTLRVFVSPRLRDSLTPELWTRQREDLHRRIIEAIFTKEDVKPEAHP